VSLILTLLRQLIEIFPVLLPDRRVFAGQ